MKLVLVIGVILLVGYGEASKRGEHDDGHRMQSRDNEKPHEIYVKRADDLRIPYPRPIQNQCELCCGGKKYNGQFSYSMACCGAQPYDSNKARCCGPNILKFNQTDNGVWQCCGNNTLINSTANICCGAKVYDRKPLQQCCGNQIYNAKKSVCCNGKVSPYPSYDTWNCCGGTTYDTTKQQCLNGTLVTIAPGIKPLQCGGQTIDYTKQMCCLGKAVTRNSNYSLCCGTGQYNSLTEKCCGSKKYPSSQTLNSDCCGTSLYNTSTHTCCKGVAVITPTGSGCSSFGCCGTQLYNYSDTTAVCCQDNLTKIKISPNPPTYNYLQCCGNRGYNPNINTCCNFTTIVAGANALCCGSRTYDSTTSTCCAGTLYKIGQVPLDKCCCQNGGCYNNYPIPYYGGGPGPVILPYEK